MKKLKLLLLLVVLFCANYALKAQATDTLRLIQYFSIVEPAYLSSVYNIEEGMYSTAQFGDDLANQLVLGSAIFAEVDSTLCADDGTDFTGKIALIRRGTCQFSEKALIAQNKGAIAAIIINNTPVPPLPDMAMGISGSLVTIPVIMISLDLGNQLEAAIDAGQPITISLGAAPAGFTRIEGRVALDDNENCAVDAGETAVKQWQVALQNSLGTTSIHRTNNGGNYHFYANPALAPFQLSVNPPISAWNLCPPSALVTSNTVDTVEVNFSAKPLFNCIQLETDISSPFLRRCFDADFYLSVCNQGTEVAQNSYVEVTLDPDMDPISTASMPFTVLGADLYRFDLGNLDPLACAFIQFKAMINCDSTELTETLCYTAHAYPDTRCVSSDPAWNGASINVSGTCVGDEVEFKITNTGTAPMSSAGEYIVIQDDVMYMNAPFFLGAGQSITVPVPANGHTWRIEAEQEIAHPIPGNPSRTVEGCSTTDFFTTGFSMMYPIYDLGYAIDEECQEVIGSFDPNDKQGLPFGFGPDHLIRPNTYLDYRIRFQNTGTDTAFTVVVRDTLPEALDPMTIRSLASSHNYTMEVIQDHILIFRFNHILLVDSFTNEAASHGFVSFRIDQKADNPYGTLIENNAAIYFDFNAPVITNRTRHEVGEVVDLTPVRNLPGVQVPAIFPNPAAPTAVLQLKGQHWDQANWQLTDLEGRIVDSGSVSGNSIQLSQSNLPSGTHLLEIITRTGERYLAKLIITQ